MRFRQLLPAAAYVVVWLAVSTVAAVGFFLHSERTIELASHESTLTPDFSGEIEVRTGPVLPDLRVASGARIGVDIVLGKTDATSMSELTDRYAAIASQPEAQVAKVERAVRDMAIDAVARGLAFGTLPILGWLLIGERRRQDLIARMPTREGVIVLMATGLVVVGLTAPWRGLGAEDDRPPEEWMPLQEFLGPEIPLPTELRGVEVHGDATTGQTRRLVESAINSYQEGTTFYEDLTVAAGEIDLHEPEEGETVVLLVSDRHDNIGMDAVAEAIGRRGGATAVFDLGDDTSTGEAWEAFSLDSLAEAFADYDRWAVAGNHDHGTFVRSYLSELGWTFFDGEVLDGPGGSRLLGVDDPRSSGLGDWRDETDLSFDEVRQRLADAACSADEEGDRVTTLLVHDTNLGKAALQRGCVDLVVGGHIHVQTGPDPVVGENGAVGYNFTNGTTGGAAYAIALGTKLRRAAGVALVTYRDGRPVGIQGVTIQTTGRFDVDDYTPLSY